METMGDLLQALREFVCMDCSKEEAYRIFGWNVLDISVKTPDDFESLVLLELEKGLMIEARYFLNEGLRDLGDDCEFRLKLKAKIHSRIRYNVFYSGYIHGQGYIRIGLGDIENKMLARVLDDYYVPRLKSIYKPVIAEFKGFYSKDFFGVEADNDGAYIYYSSVRPRSEGTKASILDVVSRLYHLESVMRSVDLLRNLAELDMQMSFLPSVMWM
jgi:hypothetical protein